MTDRHLLLARIGASMDSEITRVMMAGIFYPAAVKAAMEYELLGRRTRLRIGTEDVRG
jgi:hypothetical protein